MLPLGISLGSYDHSLPVTIDPVLAYATHLGGTTGQDLSTETSFPADTFISAIGLDGNGNIYVGGTTSATDYPTTAGAFDRSANTQAIFHEDATTQSGFVSKFDKTGRILIYSTFLRVRWKAWRWIHPASSTARKLKSMNFPDPTLGSTKAFILTSSALTVQSCSIPIRSRATDTTSPACQAFSSSTVGRLIADNSGHVYLAGNTTNPCLPATAGAFQKTLPNPNTTGYVAKFNTNVAPASSLVFSTYLGGSDGIDSVNASRLIPRRTCMLPGPRLPPTSLTARRLVRDRRAYMYPN